QARAQRPPLRRPPLRPCAGPGTPRGRRRARGRGPVKEASMPTIQDNLLWGRYDWRNRGDEWSEPWGTSAHMWYGTILPRILRGVPCDHILEIAPGHGRCTQFLRLCCRRLSVVDLVQDCVDACRARFGEGAGIEYHVNDGRTLPMIATAS